MGNVVLAWRNIWRNKRRSAATISSIAFGFAAISLFAGYTKTSYYSIANVAVHSELTGHFVITKKDFTTLGKLNPSKYMLQESEISRIKQIIEKKYPGALVAPKLSTSGLLSNGQNSAIFIAEGIAPNDLETLRGPVKGDNDLSDDKPDGIIVSEDLAKMMGLKAGDDASLLASTLYGQTNAVDASVNKTFNTGNAATNDKVLFLPLNLAQSLLDAQGRADSLSILLPSTDKMDIDKKSPLDAMPRMRYLYMHDNPDEKETQKIKKELLNAFATAGLNTDVRTWQEVSAFYRQVKDLYNVIFGMLLVVVLSVVILSIANAMSMSVIERTREIGTLRSIGMRKSGVVGMFMQESLLLVLVGIGVGAVLLIVGVTLVNFAEIRFNPPTYTISVPLCIGYDMPKIGLTLIALTVLSVLAAYIPARRAVSQLIIDSLGHV